MSKQTDDKTITLEQKLLRLQEIQKKLESGSVSLTESMVMFEEAAKLKVEIELELEKIKLKITEIENSQKVGSNLDI
jgi:exodeoxyribonuclease VII small subunit